MCASYIWGNVIMHKANRAHRNSTFATTSFALSIAATIALCGAIYCVSAHAAVSRVDASAATSGTIGSSPSSGPVGTTVSVSGSGWSQVVDGTAIYFGYMIGSNCSLVSDSQNGAFSSGAFSGWFRWPLNTSLGNYRVCAIISGSGQTLTAGTFRVLSTTPPQVSIAPGALQENQQATITATNYFPQGTSVTFEWATMSNTIVKTLGSALSNPSGTALFTFTVPSTTEPSGEYLVEGVTGGGQPAALFSSANFSYTAPIVKPSPTPGAQPSPSPTPAQNPTPTMGVTTTPTASAGITPTVGSTPTPVSTQSSGGAGVTPTRTTNGASTTPTATTGSGASGSSSGQSNNIVLIGGTTAAFVVLIALVAAALLLRRKQTRQLARLRTGPISPLASTAVLTGPMPPMSGTYGPGAFQAVPMPPMFPASPNGFGYMNVNAPNGQSGPAPLQAPQPYRELLRPMTPSHNGPSQQNGDRNGNWTALAPGDPALDAMRKQAQAGLYVAPIPGGGTGTS